MQHGAFQKPAPHLNDLCFSEEEERNSQTASALTSRNPEGWENCSQLVHQLPCIIKHSKTVQWRNAKV
jgi:hypothetical protein